LEFDLYVSKENEATKIIEILETMQFSYPIVVKIISKMKKKGLIETKTRGQNLKRNSIYAQHFIKELNINQNYQLLAQEKVL